MSIFYIVALHMKGVYYGSFVCLIKIELTTAMNIIQIGIRVFLLSNMTVKNTYKISAILERTQIFPLGANRDLVFATNHEKPFPLTPFLSRQYPPFCFGC
jgi:hypothetical protein